MQLVPASLGVFCVLFVGIATAADDPIIKVEVSAEEIFVGDSVDYQVEIRNLQNPPAPDLTAIKQQFDVVAGGNQSRNHRSISNINGRRSDVTFYSHIYQFHLTPRASGDLTIPPVTITVDGNIISSSEVPLKVIEAEKQDLVLVEVAASHQRVYPTQPFQVTARILVQPLPNGLSGDPLTPLRAQPPHLQINWADIPKGLNSEETHRWLQPLIADDGVGFTLNEISARTNSFFDMSRAAVFGLSKGREARTRSDGEKVRYYVYELTRTFNPESPGEYHFGPAVVKGTFVTDVEGRRPTGRKLVAIAPATSVEVREVPSPRPPTFCGGIGEYQVSATANPMALRVGDPLTLTLEFRRGPQTGSLELVSAPDLSAVLELARDFDLVDKSPTGRTEGAVKKFSYALRPKKPGVEIPTLNISTFDPIAEDFVDCHTASIPIEVSEGTRLTAQDLVGSLPTNNSPSIKSRAEGIFQNITDLTELRDERVDVTLWSEVAGGLWIVSIGFVACLTFYRRRSTDAEWVRRQQARKIAQRRLAEARTSLAGGHSREAIAVTRLAIVGLVADLSGRIADGLTCRNVSEILSAKAVPEKERDELVSLLESIESAEYGAALSTDPAAAIERASTLIGKVSPFLERGA